MWAAKPRTRPRVRLVIVRVDTVTKNQSAALAWVTLASHTLPCIRTIFREKKPVTLTILLCYLALTFEFYYLPGVLILRCASVPSITLPALIQSILEIVSSLPFVF